MSAPGYDLTARQRELLAYLRERDSCPSFVEMRDVLGLASKSGVHRLLEALEERGYIRRLKRRARSIEVLDRPLPDAPPRCRRAADHPDVIEIPLYTRLQLNWRPEKPAA